MSQPQKKLLRSVGYCIKEIKPESATSTIILAHSCKKGDVTDSHAQFIKQLIFEFEQHLLVWFYTNSKEGSFCFVIYHWPL